MDKSLFSTIVGIIVEFFRVFYYFTATTQCGSHRNKCLICDAKCSADGCPKRYSIEPVFARMCYWGPTPPSNGCPDSMVKVVGICQSNMVCPRYRNTPCLTIETPEKKCKGPAKWNGSVCIENGKPVCKAPLKMFGKVCRPTVKCGEGYECVLCEKICQKEGCPRGFNFRRQDHFCYPGGMRKLCSKPGEVMVAGMCQTRDVCDKKRQCRRIIDAQQWCQFPNRWNGKVCLESGKPTCKGSYKMINDMCRPTVKCGKGLECILCDKTCQKEGCPKGFERQDHLCYPAVAKT